MRTVPHDYPSCPELVAAYQDADLDAHCDVFGFAETAWRHACAPLSDQGTSALGAGYDVWYVPLRARFGHRRCVVGAPCQGNVTNQRTRAAAAACCASTASPRTTTTAARTSP